MKLCDEELSQIFSAAASCKVNKYGDTYRYALGIFDRWSPARSGGWFCGWPFVKLAGVYRSAELITRLIVVVPEKRIVFDRDYGVSRTASIGKVLGEHNGGRTGSERRGRNNSRG